MIEHITSYLAQVLEQPSNIRKWHKKRVLPLFLRDYSFYQMELLQRKCLLMIAKPDVHVTPTELKKQMARVELEWSGMVIFVEKEMPFYTRQRLMKQRIPFIVPGRHIYLPNLGIDVRKRSRNPKTLKKCVLNPATQAALLFALLSDRKLTYTTSDFCSLLNYSRMTIIRAFNELEANRIGETLSKNRERIWTFEGTKKELWQLIKPHLHSPVQKRLWVKNHKRQILAGESALAKYSKLNPPKIPVYTDFGVKVADLQTVPTKDGADALLEIWSYDPALLAQGKKVDPFSLFLSFKANNDERIQEALETMMENYQW